MNATGIEWCDFSAALLKYRDADGRDVWACEKCSPGCRGCYAEAMAARFKRGGPFTRQVMKTVTPYFCEKEAARILKSKKLAGKRVFMNDMTDTFGEWVPFEIIDKMFAVFALRPDVVFQILTKRPERMAEYLAMDFPVDRLLTILRSVSSPWNGLKLAANEWIVGNKWGLRNAWFGASVEDVKRKSRIDELREVPGAIRFLSLEPLLEDLGELDLRNINWVIVGGESGHGARPMHPNWARSIRDQCVAAGVPFFFKQWGNWAPASIDHLGEWCEDEWIRPDGSIVGPKNAVGPSDAPMVKSDKKSAGRVLDGREWNEMPEIATVRT
jgi:protein gp37